jgi:hypothetical protein
MQIREPKHGCNSYQTHTCTCWDVFEAAYNALRFLHSLLRMQIKSLAPEARSKLCRAHRCVAHGLWVAEQYSFVLLGEVAIRRHVQHPSANVLVGEVVGTVRCFRSRRGKNTSWTRGMRGISYCTSIMSLSSGVYTTLFTYAGVSENYACLQRLGADLEESFEPPNLEHTLSYQHA